MMEDPQPIVLNITPEFEPEGGEIGKKLGREIGVPLVLSINVDLKMNKQGEE